MRIEMTREMRELHLDDPLSGDQFIQVVLIATRHATKRIDLRKSENALKRSRYHSNLNAYAEEYLRQRNEQELTYEQAISFLMDELGVTEAEQDRMYSEHCSTDDVQELI